MISLLCMATSFRACLCRYSFAVQPLKYFTMSSNLKPIVVGISGVTNGGKSMVSERLNGLLPNPSVLFKQDDYFYPVGSHFHIQSPGGIQHINWEVISGLDMTKMANDVEAAISKLQLDKSSELRSIIILDGFTIYDDPRIRDLCDVKLFLKIDKEICKERRTKRTYDPPDPPGYFDACVWPMYLEHLIRIEKLSDVIFIEGDKDFDNILDQTKQEIYRKL